VDLPGTELSLPVFPGGITVGVLFVTNLVVAQVARLKWSLRKSGLWIAHAGLILLVSGEFISALFQVDMQMSVEEGQTVNFVESTRAMELAVTDTTDAKFDDLYGIPEAMLENGGAVSIPGTRFRSTSSNSCATPSSRIGGLSIRHRWPTWASAPASTRWKFRRWPATTT